MPLNDDDLRDVQGRVLYMFNDSVATVREIRTNADWLFEGSADDIRAAIDECLLDFVDSPGGANQVHPEAAIYGATSSAFQNVGFYGAQLAVKERQVLQANDAVRKSLLLRLRNKFRSPFKKWVDRINNFLRSLIAATGTGEALKELKDVLAGELDDKD